MPLFFEEKVAGKDQPMTRRMPADNVPSDPPTPSKHGQSETGEMITLREAYDRWKHATHHGNAFNWYLRQAQEGRKPFHFNAPYRTQTSVRKVAGTWMIAIEELENAVQIHCAEKAEIARATNDYKRRILHGKPGDTVQTEWGVYTVYDGLHSTIVSSPDPAWNGTVRWYCSICWEPAETEHNNPECHTCRDWGGCRRDCTFSRASCRKCATSHPPGSRSLRSEVL